MSFIDKDIYINITTPKWICMNNNTKQNTKQNVNNKDPDVLFDGRVIYIPKSILNASYIFNTLLNIDEWFSYKGKKILHYPIDNFTLAGKMIIKALEDFFYSYNLTIFIHKIFGNYYPTGKSNAIISKNKHKYDDMDVVSLSFGESRLFYFKKNIQEPTRFINLSHGDILIFDKYMNNNYIHGITKESFIKNISFNIICFVTFFTK